MTLLPLVNEKTYDLFKSKNTYVFNVPKKANKQAIKRAVKEQFEVDVLSVKTTTIKGKPKRTLSITGRRALNANGQRPDLKKAYVTINKDKSLPFFESVEEAEEKRKSSQEKIDKAMERQTKKESKVKQPNTAPKRRFLKTKKPEGK